MFRGGTTVNVNPEVFAGNVIPLDGSYREYVYETTGAAPARLTPTPSTTAASPTRVANDAIEVPALQCLTVRGTFAPWNQPIRASASMQAGGHEILQ